MIQRQGNGSPPARDDRLSTAYGQGIRPLSRPGWGRQCAATEVDAVVISAHGELEEGNYGALYLNEEELSAKLVGKLEAWVVYFDSCQQGVNLAYLDAFQEESDIQFYLAPIISNDAGDSSTKTMVWFFTAVLQHKQPIRALFDTRKRLFAFYDKQQKLDIVTTLNKAFPFRLYEFVDGEGEDDE